MEVIDNGGQAEYISFDNRPAERGDAFLAVFSLIDESSLEFAVNAVRKVREFRADRRLKVWEVNNCERERERVCVCGGGVEALCLAGPATLLTVELCLWQILCGVRDSGWRVTFALLPSTVVAGTDCVACGQQGRLGRRPRD